MSRVNPTHEEVLKFANIWGGSDCKRFSEFSPIEVELAFKSLLLRSADIEWVRRVVFHEASGQKVL